MNAEQCKTTGCYFYKPPVDLEPADIDPLLWHAIYSINQSGWVWTAESCQGHPDATGFGVWANNVRPMLRLVTRRENLGRMLGCLIESLDLPMREVEGFLCPEQMLSCQIYPHKINGWCEILVYIDAATAFDRNAGIAALEDFGARLLLEAAK